MNNYFQSTGKYQALNTALEELIPAMGEVRHPDLNPALETFRKASNAYYDLYNNGGGNRDGDILIYAGIWDSAECNFDQSFHNGDCDMLGGHDFDHVAEKFEPEMDRIIMEAAIEQISRLATLRQGLANVIGDLGKEC